MSTAESRAQARALEGALRAEGHPERADQEKRYLKSSLDHLGVSVPATRRVVRTFLAGQDLDHAGLVALVEALWARPIHECRAAAVELLEARPGLLGPRDLPLLERLIRESRTWALVDNLAASVLGPLAERHPALGRKLPAWGKDPDFWIRRAALLAHLIALREGRGDLAAFGRLADPLLGEGEFFIRKAIGWVLRDASKADPEGVIAWLEPRAARAAPLTVREAVKRLPAAARARILAAAGLSAGSSRVRAAPRAGPPAPARR
ncbi:MAG: DNA alkylation repair protein [Anaeromyxobacter sp.]